MRGRILGAFEEAELAPDPDRRAAWSTPAVVGHPGRHGDQRSRLGSASAELPHDSAQARIQLRDSRDDGAAGGRGRQAGPCWRQDPPRAVSIEWRESRPSATRPDFDVVGGAGSERAAGSCGAIPVRASHRSPPS
jgi:hypothetical protein